MIRILFVVNGFAIGGGELKLLELVRQMLADFQGRFHVVVCSVGQGGPLEERFRALGVRTEIFAKRHKYDLSQVRRVAALLRAEKIDLVQTTLFYADIIGTLAARWAGIRGVISWEAVTQPYGIKHLLAYRLASKGFTCAVAVSDAIRHQIITQRHVPEQKTRTIRYGVDLEAFSPSGNRGLRKSWRIPDRAVVLGTVARFSRQKGHCYLIDAACGILKKYPDVHFVLAGDGPLRPELEYRVRSLGIGESFHFLGFRHDVRDCVNAFDVFVLPSLYEGLPNAVLEAMACAKPVVATAVDGTPEAVVDGETGLLVPPEDPEALEDALGRLLANRRTMRIMGEKGRRRIENHFALEGQIQQFVDLYTWIHATAR